MHQRASPQNESLQMFDNIHKIKCSLLHLVKIQNRDALSDAAVKSS